MLGGLNYERIEVTVKGDFLFSSVFRHQGNDNFIFMIGFPVVKIKFSPSYGSWVWQADLFSQICIGLRTIEM